METSCKIYYCYKATNIVNGKVYIGFAGSPKQRWSQHKRDAEQCKGFALADAIRKHGWTAFEFEVIWHAVLIFRIYKIQILAGNK